MTPETTTNSETFIEAIKEEVEEISEEE